MSTVCVRLLRRYWKEKWGILWLLENMRLLVQLLKQGWRKLNRVFLTGRIQQKKEPGHHKLVLIPAQKKELVEYILCIESRLFGLTLDALRSLALELAERNGLYDRFNKNKKKAGKAWLYAFLNRHPNIKLRSPEPTSLARAMGFNRRSVEKNFSLLTEMMEKHKIPPERQVAYLSSAERGVLLTVEICIGAGGAFMPPLFVFPRARAKPELLDDALPGSRPVTISQIGRLFGNASMEFASVQTAVSGLRKMEVHPLNPEIFPDWMFELAETTNRPIQGEMTSYQNKETLHLEHHREHHQEL
ncbi:hypothetical protein JTB14_026522 [Gonioctena quinquepunctata]|nr:hypothetical protein JTB14_026522 [Gonioctena quinquepunctata]